MKTQEDSLQNDLLGDMLRSWAAAAGFAGLHGAGHPGGQAITQAITQSITQSITQAITQAHGVAAGTSMRVWTRGAQSLAQYQQESAAAGGAADADQVARQADAARAHLRRLGEIALEEAHTLDTILQGLAEQLRASMETPATGADLPPRRYARAKP